MKQILISVGKNFSFSLAAIIFLLAMTNCTSGDEDNGSTTIIDDSDTDSSSSPEGSAETGYNEDDLIIDASFSSTVLIDFGTTVSITNPMEGNGISVVLSDADVVVTSTVEGVAYRLTGSTTNGSVKIYSDYKFKLSLNGVNISNLDGPAINIQSEKRAFIVLESGTTNLLSDGSSYAASDEDMKGTLFSEGQMIFSGDGSLSVTGNYKHGIASDDYVRIISGNIAIAGAKTDGIHTNEAVIVDGGVLNVTASSDGLECEEGYIIVNDGALTFNVGDDGIAASYEESDAAITPFVNINGGTIKVNSSAGEGIESKSALTINAGTIETITSDDGLNASDAIYINGGYVYSYAKANDAMDSNGIFTITGGIVVAIGARQPEAGIDCDARTLKITGGIVVGIGGATSGPTASVSTVPSVIMGSGAANQLIHIEGEDGAAVLTFLAPVAYNTMLFASADLKQNMDYTVYTGGSVVNGSDFHGLYLNGSYTKGTSSLTFTTSSMVTQKGGSISRG